MDSAEPRNKYILSTSVLPGMILWCHCTYRLKTQCNEMLRSWTSSIFSMTLILPVGERGARPELWS